MSGRVPLLIDTDPGVDDALALLMAMHDDAHAIVGLTIAAGNVGLEHTVRNALKLCEVAGRDDIPVFAGAPAPLLHPARDAACVHGRDGFGDIGYAAPARAPEAEHAALAILRLSQAHAGRLVLVALGPLTNLALALKLDQALPGALIPLRPEKTVAGIAFTVMSAPNVKITGEMETRTEMLSALTPDAVILWDSSGDERATLWGGVMTATAEGP